MGHISTDPSFAKYLKPTGLCDFQGSAQIIMTAKKLIIGSRNAGQAAVALAEYIREFPYVLEDWDTKASETLQKQCGMCSGKSNLLVAMARSLGMPARYVVIRIETEMKLWQWVADHSGDHAREIGKASPEQDHVYTEIFTGNWEKFDISRDTAFEAGLKMLGIPLERKTAVSTAGWNPIILDSFDEWASDRQAARRFRENRPEIFRCINAQLDEVRSMGRTRQ